uniref:Uncharacterized protein n=1 Tax=Ditylenchus dipsaci TaxID=166011 RepID=A0A915E1K7_9BILA
MPNQEAQEKIYAIIKPLQQRSEDERDVAEPSSSLNNVADEELEPITTIYNHHKEWENAFHLMKIKVRMFHTTPSSLYVTRLTLMWKTASVRKCVNYVLKYITKGAFILLAKLLYGGDWKQLMPVVKSYVLDPYNATIKDCTAIVFEPLELTDY